MSIETPIAYRIIDSFYRSRRLFLISTLLVAGIPAAVLLTRPKSYMATAQIQIVPDVVTDQIGPDAAGQTWIPPAGKSVNQLNDCLTDDSPTGFLHSALTLADLRHPINIDPRARDPRRDRLRKQLQVAATSDTIVSINLIWNNVAECEKIVRAIQQRYIDEMGERREAQSAAVAQFLDDYNLSVTARLDAADKALTEYQRTHFGQTTDATANAYRELAALIMHLDDVSVNAASSRLRLEGLEQRIKEMRRTTLVNERLISPHDVAEAGLQLSPAYRELLEQITEAKVEIQQQEQERDRLQKTIDAYNAKMATIPAATRELTSRTRNVSTLKTEYECLAQQCEQARLQANIDKVSGSLTFRAVGTIYAEATTDTRKTALTLAVLALLGMTVGTILIVITEWMDPSLHYHDDAERLLSVPVLATVPDAVGLNYLPAESDSTRRQLQ